MQCNLSPKALTISDFHYDYTIARFAQLRPKLGPPFDFPTTFAGETKWQGTDGVGVRVYYDPSLGSLGQSNADTLVNRLSDLMTYCDNNFNIRGKSGNVIIAQLSGVRDGNGGAYHYACGFNSDLGGIGSDWYVDQADNDPTKVYALCMAEISESYMGLQNKGWNCGGSGGEGLSRVFAEAVSGGPNGSLAPYTSGPYWDGTDWISTDSLTDRDISSTGCSVLYLYWMMSLGYTLAQITQAGEPDGTLKSNYNVVTGRPASQAFDDFLAAINSIGGRSKITNDNPFVGAPPPPPPPPPGPGPAPPTTPPGKSGPVFEFNRDNLIYAKIKDSVTLTAKLLSLDGIGDRVYNQINEVGDKTNIEYPCIVCFTEGLIPKPLSGDSELNEYEFPVGLVILDDSGSKVHDNEPIYVTWIKKLHDALHQQRLTNLYEVTSRVEAGIMNNKKVAQFQGIKSAMTVWCLAWDDRM